MRGRQGIDAVRSIIKPMLPGYGSPSDACYALIEIFVDDQWWHEVSRNFHLVPGENKQRAEQWVAKEIADIHINYDVA